jgi:peptidoglycan hydrolase-like protein with peptidoglycan-binding domain
VVAQLTLIYSNQFAAAGEEDLHVVEPPIKSRLESHELTTDVPKETQKRLNDCLASDSLHILPAKRGGKPGPHVEAIQKALETIRQAAPDLGLPVITDKPGVYGESTAAAVLKYKDINGIKRTGQALDDIVGRMTLTQLDNELLNRAHPSPKPIPPGPKPAPLGAKVAWTPLRPPVVISQLNDKPDAQDLENSDVRLNSAKLKALKKVGGTDPIGTCERKLLTTIGQGGPEARELAEFFISNSEVKFERPLPAFWSGAVSKDGGFLQNHAKLSFAIQDSLKLIKDAATGVPPEVDVNRLAQGAAQPGRLKSFKNDFDFGGSERRSRHDPLAFGIGGTQGHLVSIISFTGEPDGGYEGVLLYELVDHFGSDDGDLDIPLDEGQPSLWLLQRKIVINLRRSGCEPYRHRTKVELGFVGHLV